MFVEKVAEKVALRKEKYPTLCRNKKLKKSLQEFIKKYGPALKKLAQN